MLRSLPDVKKRGKKMNFYLILFCISLSIGVTGQLFLKKGMLNIGEIILFSEGIPKFFKNMFKIFTNKVIIVGVLLFGCSSLLWLVILSGLELSYIYPMVSISYALIALSSRVFFKESVTKMRWLSIAVIIMGVILVSSS